MAGHQKKDIRKALKYAEEHDWTVEEKKSKGHAWGRVISPDGGVSIRVDKTPKNPGDRAKDIKNAVDQYEKNLQQEAQEQEPNKQEGKEESRD